VRARSAGGRRPRARPVGGTARPAFANAGDASPSLSLSVTPAGQPDAAAVGKGGSLWFYTQRNGHWHRTEVGRAGAADSGPSLFAGTGGVVYVVVEGPSHTLQFYALSGCPRKFVGGVRRPS
jgi:hypothetical protein